MAILLLYIFHIAKTICYSNINKRNTGKIEGGNDYEGTYIIKRTVS